MGTQGTELFLVRQVRARSPQPDLTKHCATAQNLWFAPIGNSPLMGSFLTHYHMLQEGREKTACWAFSGAVCVRPHLAPSPLLTGLSEPPDLCSPRVPTAPLDF